MLRLSTMIRLYDICCFIFAGIQALAAVFTVWDRIRWKKIVNSKSASPKIPRAEFHLVVTLLLIVGAGSAAGRGGYLVGHPITPPPQEAYPPCQTSNTGNTGNASATAGQGGTAAAHSGHGDTYNLPTPPKTK